MSNTNNANIIIVADSRCGESSAFNTMEDFRQAMLAGDWTEEDFESFLNNEEAPDVHEAELVRVLGDDCGLYVCEDAHNAGYGRYETRYVYYRVWGDGSLRYVDTFDHPADAEELDEMCE